MLREADGWVQDGEEEEPGPGCLDASRLTFFTVLRSFTIQKANQERDRKSGMPRRRIFARIGLMPIRAYVKPEGSAIKRPRRGRGLFTESRTTYRFNLMPTP
jgi:hypothetical protein